MTLADAIRARRSIRLFTGEPVPERIICEMLEAARLSPSGGNSQSWMFGVARDAALKEELAAAAGGQMWIASAPVVFACCADISWDVAAQPEDDFGVAVNRLRFGNDFIDYLCAYPGAKARTTLFENPAPLIPAEHIALTAAAHGLGSCFIGYLDVERASRALGLPPHIVCLFLLPVGYPAQPPREIARKAISDISFYDRWPEG